MALPALRQPKIISEKVEKRVYCDTNYVILTLKNNTKLVVTSDAYHGIITEEEMFKCVYCSLSIERNPKYKDLHKCTPKHKECMANIPYIEDYDQHLMRQINKMDTYCTICNVILPIHAVSRHVATEVHTDEINRASARGLAYKPYT